MSILVFLHPPPPRPPPGSKRSIGVFVFWYVISVLIPSSYCKDQIHVFIKSPWSSVFIYYLKISTDPGLQKIQHLSFAAAFRQGQCN